MTKVAEQKVASRATQYATFYCGDSLLGLDISYVQEINRSFELTQVPLSSSCVRGVMNLRGEVVTMLDLRTLMGQPSSMGGPSNRNLIIKNDGDIFGLWVDGVADILTIETSAITQPPSNLSIAESRLIRGVYQSEKSLVMLIEPKEVLSASLSLLRNAA